MCILHVFLVVRPVRGGAKNHSSRNLMISGMIYDIYDVFCDVYDVFCDVYDVFVMYIWCRPQQPEKKAEKPVANTANTFDALTADD